jgi:hypothetical protein
VSELSEHDWATLKLIEQQLAQEDPRLTRLLARFGRSDRSLWRPSHGWLLVGLSGLGCLLLAALLIILALT